MHSTRVKRAWRMAILVGLLGVWGCSSSDTAPDTFVPDFTFVWQAQNDTTHTFNLFANQGQATGSFTSGSSERFKGTNSDLQGTFDHHNVQFTTSRLVNGSRASFTGSFTNNDTINLQSPEGAITLVRIKS
jgi:hypothetical protein